MTSTAAPAADFSCSICLDTASEPVVTRCGHLFCWECLDHWLHSAIGAPECPVCKGRVDERMAGDIIPLYGKGRQPANMPSGSSAPAPTTHATAAPVTTAAAAATATTADAEVDLGQAEFFRRPTAYSYAPARDARRSAASTARPAAPGEAAEEQHHPRPSADRAPPRPRPPHQQQHPNIQMHMHTHGMPLTVGSSVFFFGGGGGMFLSIILIVAWAVYNYAPWREWRRDAVRWYHRARGQPVPEEEEHDAAAAAAAPGGGGGGGGAAAENAGAAQAAAGGNPPEAQAPPAGAGANALPLEQTMMRNLVYSLLGVFVLFQLLLFV